MTKKIIKKKKECYKEFRKQIDNALEQAGIINEYFGSDTQPLDNMEEIISCLYIIKKLLDTTP